MSRPQYKHILKTPSGIQEVYSNAMAMIRHDRHGFPEALMPNGSSRTRYRLFQKLKTEQAGTQKEYILVIHGYVIEKVLVMDPHRVKLDNKAYHNE